MPELKCILFDVDGVIIDSKEANAEFYAVLLEKAGYKRPPRAEIDKYFHLPMWQGIEKLTGSHDEAEIRRIWQLGHDRSVYPAHLLVFPDSLEGILAELQKQYRLAIVTSRVKDGVESLYTSKDIAMFFDATVTYEDYTNPKPDPEPLQVALRKLGVKPSEAVYIGDSHVDVEAAKAAGVLSIHLAPQKHNDATVGVTNFNEIVDAIDVIAEQVSRTT